ncbi:MAG: orotate phosphoribosyltransferase [Euryarchaeota archaeon]|nr:orotate phosphoribosyltransferase [Euryarchaeota archaeon]
MLRALTNALKEKGVIKFGDFTLTSGRKSNYYIDIKKAATDPALLNMISGDMSELVKKEKPAKIAGIAIGAIPIATAISLRTNIPMVIVRKQTKEHGIERLVEGEINLGEKVVIIEDVSTTGGSIIEATKAVRDLGGIVEKAFVVVDRLEGASESLKMHGIILVPLITVQDLGVRK